MTTKTELMNAIIKQEDAARSIRNSVGASGLAHVNPETVEELADAVANLAQAVRDALQRIHPSDFGVTP